MPGYITVWFLASDTYTSNFIVSQSCVGWVYDDYKLYLRISHVAISVILSQEFACNRVAIYCVCQWKLAVLKHYMLFTGMGTRRWSSRLRCDQDPQLPRRDRELALPAEKGPRHCYFSRCDWVVKVHVVLISVVQLYFMFIISWRVNTIINYRLATSNSTYIA